MSRKSGRRFSDEAMRGIKEFGSTRLQETTRKRATLRSAIIAACLGAATAPLMAALVLPVMAEKSVAEDAPNAVGIDNFTFNPQKLTIKSGTTVTWTNRDDIPHTVAAVDREFKSKALDTGDAYSFTFTTPGSYQYFCSLHPHMTGTIVVEAATGSNAAK
jgi:amicyanin